MKGIDISTHNEKINWDKLSENVDFVIIRAGFGNTVRQKDYRFDENIEGAINKNIAIGVYWFSYALNTDEAVKEAEAMMEVIEPYKDKITLPCFIDFEYDSDRYCEEHGTKHTNATRTGVITAFCNTVINAGYNCGFYANLDYCRNKLRTYELLQRFPLWLAQYNKNSPEYPALLVQYSSSGKVSGINGNVDLNYWVEEVKKMEYTSDTNNTAKNPVKIKRCKYYTARIRGDITATLTNNVDFCLVLGAQVGKDKYYSVVAIGEPGKQTWVEVTDGKTTAKVFCAVIE